MSQDPIARFHRWYAAAQGARNPLPDACALATADRRGRPSVRFVLLKGADARGFSFFTHDSSPKGRDLAANPRAALAFYWDRSGRQVRISGRVVGVPEAEADAYWATRPRESQIGAWASRQSQPLSSRSGLLGRAAALARRFAGRAVPRPRGWRGYRIIPDRIEFWSRRSFRLHHRELFLRKARGWKRTLLQP